jgi:hypothetical protein
LGWRYTQLLDFVHFWQITVKHQERAFDLNRISCRFCSSKKVLVEWWKIRNCLQKSCGLGIFGDKELKVLVQSMPNYLAGFMETH